MYKFNDKSKLFALESALNAVDAMIAIKDLEGYYIYSNKAVNDYYKDRYDSIVGLHYKEIYPESEQKVVEELDQEVLEANRPISKTIYVLTDEGHIYVDSTRAPVRDNNNDIIGIVSVGSNVNERELNKQKLQKSIVALQDLSDKFEHLSYYDELTTIPNRRKFYSDFLNLSKSTMKDYTLILIDLNNFKLVNDVHGHETGDILLRKFALSIQNIANSFNGEAYRLGGDEFSLLYPSKDNSFSKSVSTLNNLLQDFHIDTSISYGEIQISTDDEINTVYRDLCVKRADTLLYEYKDKVKNN